MLDRKDFKLAGVINKPHGVKGELNLGISHPWNFDEAEFDFILLDTDGYLVPYYIEEMSITSDEKGFVTLENITTNEQAAKLTGSHFYLPIEIFNTDNDFTVYQDLIGYTLYSHNNLKVGSITDFIDIPNNPVVEVIYNENEVLVPINDELIVNLSIENKSIHIKIPDGLL